LRDAAQRAYDESTKPADDMFGNVPRATRSDSLRRLNNDTSGSQILELGSGRKPDRRDAQAGADDARGAAGVERAQRAEHQGGARAAESKRYAAGRCSRWWNEDPVEPLRSVGGTRLDFFQSTRLTEAEANDRGLLARAVGKRAYAIANDGDTELIAAHRSNGISDEAAFAIATAAPKDGRLQAVGIRAVLDGKPIVQAANIMRAVKMMAGEREELPTWTK